MNTTHWIDRPVTPPEVKLNSLRIGLFWTFSVIQGFFLATIGYAFLRAELLQNGETMHDLGVMIGREMFINQVFGYWVLTTVASATVAALVYFTLKNRWTK